MSPILNYKLSPWMRVRNMKQRVGIRRINRELQRHKIAAATFIPVPILVMSDGTARIPLSYLRTKLAK